MPHRDNPLWINRNPGVFAAIVAFVFTIPSYALLWNEIGNTNSDITCVVKTISTRDASTTASRDSLLEFVDEFILFLEKIDTQVSANPLLRSLEDFKTKQEGVQIVTDAKDLEECLGE